MASPVTFELDDETLSTLDAYATRVDRPRNLLVNEALADWLAYESWKLEEIEAGIADADAGRFASDEDIARILGKYAGSR